MLSSEVLMIVIPETEWPVLNSVQHPSNQSPYRTFFFSSVRFPIPTREIHSNHTFPSSERESYIIWIKTGIN
ncbi:hypothetical protein VNO78_04089 [Psophocarpus tetragonolobus]|uniref:Uncharacterized protein n=1 Tax=Psophocarpus tetragonolobus TaxID=3891 RepID=A0AAN9T1H2_PSOTE